jgi:hypothetical protein
MKNEILLKVVLFVVFAAIFIWIAAALKPDCPRGSHAVFDRYWHCEARP